MVMESAIKAFAAIEFGKIFKKCIHRYANNYGYHYTHVFMLLCLDETGQEVNYKTYANAPAPVSSYEPFKSIGIPNGCRPAHRANITILDVLDVKYFHAKGYNLFAPPYILASLQRLATENNLQPSEVAVFIYTDDVDPEKDTSLVLCRIEGNEIKQMVTELKDISLLF